MFTSKIFKSTQLLYKPRANASLEFKSDFDKESMTNKKKFDMLIDRLLFDFGFMLPLLHPLKYPWLPNTVSEKFIEANLEFQANQLFTWLLPHLFSNFRSIIPLITKIFVPLASYLKSNMGTQKIYIFFITNLFPSKLHKLILVPNQLIMHLLSLKHFTIKLIKQSSNMNTLRISCSKSSIHLFIYVPQSLSNWLSSFCR